MPKTFESGVCPYCGSRLGVSPLSAKEIALNVLCAIVVLTALFFIYRFADHWLTLKMETITDHMFWREPLQIWD